jgi:hypothetical protein
MHKALDGKRFKFSEPPVVNKKGERRNPGGDIQCRCVAIPVIPLFEGLAPQQFPGALVPDEAPARAPGNVARKAAAIPRVGAVPPQGLRPESFGVLRSGVVPEPSLPVTVAIDHDRLEPRIVDGRHRITLAREAGQTHIVGDVLYYGPRGAVKKRLRNVRIPI